MKLSYFCYDKDIDTEYKWRFKPDQLTNKQIEILYGLMNHGKLILHSSSQGPPIVGSFYCDDCLCLFQLKQTKKNDVEGRPIYLLEGFISNSIRLFCLIIPYIITKYFNAKNAYAVPHKKLSSCFIDISIDALINEDTKNKFSSNQSSVRAQMATFSNYHIEKYKDLFAIEYSKDGSTIISNKAIQASSASIVKNLEWCIFVWRSKKQYFLSFLRAPEGRLEVIDQYDNLLFQSSVYCSNDENHELYQNALKEVKSYLKKYNWQPTPLCEELFFRVVDP